MSKINNIEQLEQDLNVRQKKKALEDYLQNRTVFNDLQVNLDVDLDIVNSNRYRVFYEVNGVKQDVAYWVFKGDIEKNKQAKQHFLESCKDIVINYAPWGTKIYGSLFLDVKFNLNTLKAFLLSNYEDKLQYIV